jgi:hypothetical protein
MIARLVQLREQLDMTRVAFSTLVAAGLGAAFLAMLTLPAEARGGRGFGGHGMGHGLGGHAMHGAEFASDRRHGNDAYAKAASDERDKLLNTQLKSICRGC